MRDSDLLSPTLLQRASAAVVSSFNEYRHDDDVQVVTDRVKLDSNTPSPGPTPTSQAGTRASTQCWPGPSSGGSCAAGPVEVLLARRMCMCRKWMCPAPGLSGSTVTAVQSPAAGQVGNSKAVALKSGLTQSCQPAEGLDPSRGPGPLQHQWF